jgi:MFS family permease
VGFAIVGVAITPALEGLILLAIAIGLRGAGQGVNLPLMMTITSRSVPPTLQGRVAALRISFNRLGSALFPIGMGAIAEVIGLEAAFYVVGMTGVVLLSLLAVWVYRAKSQFASDT